MTLLWRLAFFIMAMLITNGMKLYKLKMGPLEKPDLDTNTYWGPGTPPTDIDTSVRPFTIDFDSSIIEEMRERLSDRALSKIPAPLEGTTFNYGTNTKYLKTVLTYWRDDYLTEWSDKHQKFLNKFPQFKTNVQGLDIHFIHVKSNKKQGSQKHYPLLLLHGWPGSVAEFYGFIDKLTQEDVSFDIVAPSLPGYGFSEAASKTGLNSVEMSVLLRNLMLRLGYEQFLVQGGDWGSIIGSSLTTLFPENVLGYHSNMCTTFAPMSTIKTIIASVYPKAFVPEEYVHFFYPYLPQLAGLVEETGYLHIQATKPDTIGTALTDNPIGLASYILEKFAGGTDHSFRYLEDGGLTQYYTLDQLLHNLMFYSLGNSILTSQRLYAETFSANGMRHQLDRVRTGVPTGCTRFRYDIGHTIDWALQEKFTNLIHSTYHTNGGHFAALQFPDVLTKDFVSFVKKLE